MAGDWVDDVLLGRPDAEICLSFGEPVDRGTLRRAVRARQDELAAAGLRAGGSVALWLPPSFAFVVNLLAVWRTGAQAVLLDHRLTQHEVDRGLERLLPQYLVTSWGGVPSGVRGYADVEGVLETYPGRPAATEHTLIQLSSGSTGPSKVIGRTTANLLAEIDRYTRMAGVPREGERVVLLASMVHVLGLVGGLLYGLHAGARLVLPRRTTGEGILREVAAGEEPTTVLGVPFHIELLGAVAEPPRLPQFTRMTTGGEKVRAGVAAAFCDSYSAQLGTMYGMTETGVIAEDLFGRHRPAYVPAPGMEIREEAGELLVRTERTPYLGEADPARWVAGWLHTKDGGHVDPATGLVTVHGRLDAQVSIGGLKVDLMDVEQVLSSVPGVVETVVTYDRGIEAYVVVEDSFAVADVEAALAPQLASYKQPQRFHVVDRIPRTVTGKLVRDRAALRAAREGRG